MENAGPIIRWRTATELLGEPRTLNNTRLDDVLEHSEVQKWLGLLGTGPLHHSKDSAFENCMGKLVELGLFAGVPALDEKMEKYFPAVVRNPRHWDAWFVTSFCARAGYLKKEAIADCISYLASTAHKAASRGDYDDVMTKKELEELPPSQRDKSFFKTEYDPGDGEYRLPGCYDLYTFAHCGATGALKEQMEEIVKYLVDERLQKQPAGYIWRPKQRKVFACSFARLPEYPGYESRQTTQTLLLYVEMLSHFQAGISSDWYKGAIDYLEEFITDQGTYIFPDIHLVERKNSYYLYQGSHMGLGENRRKKGWQELESTFRMMKIKKLMTEN